MQQQQQVEVEVEVEEGKRKEDEQRKEEKSAAAPLMALNHVSRLCRNVKDSIDFYTKVLGFVLMERPEVLDHFDGAWLFNYGIGIHLVQVQSKDHEHCLPSPSHSQTHRLDPMDNHISFQCEDMGEMERRLKEFNVKFIKRTMDESGTKIDQLFFNDPDGFMVEICNCENLKLVPARTFSSGSDSGELRLPFDRHNPPLDVHDHHHHHHHHHQHPNSNSNSNSN